MLIGQIHNPGILFCLAVGILIGLEVSPVNNEYPCRTILQAAYGNIKDGGIRRGIFIKEIFALAIFWLTIATYLFYHDFIGAIANGILTLALVVSVIANEIEAKIIKRIIEE